ncbi:MAG: D-alanyl-D-alanine carboxypeptidase family protein [Fimbriimonadaceae bacterium]
MRVLLLGAVLTIGATNASAILEGPKLGCSSAILIEETTGRVLWTKNADIKAFPASTTKIMTAILLIENVGPDTLITAPPNIKTVKPSSMHLQPGEQVTMKHLLYALMLRSANDAAVAAAHHISGSVVEFGKLMTKRAKEFGCTSTNFVNPNGLHDPNHYSTARDISILARQAMTYPVLREVVKTPTWWLTRSMNQEDLLVENRNEMLKDPTYDGIKTGFTKPAGECLVASATRDGMRLISVVLHADDRELDTKGLVDWGFKYYSPGTYIQKGATVTSAPVLNGAVETVEAVASEELSGVVRKDIPEKPILNIKKLEAPVEAGQVIGTAKYEGAPPIDLIAKERVAKKFPTFAASGAFGAFFVGGYALIRRKRQRIYENPY